MSNLLQSYADSQRKLPVWNACTTIPGYDAAEWRYDFAGSAIRFSDYGDRASPYGWEIDHILPTILGGRDDLSNLRARHWLSNASAGGALSGVSSGDNALAQALNILASRKR